MAPIYNLLLVIAHSSTDEALNTDSLPHGNCTLRLLDLVLVHEFVKNKASMITILFAVILFQYGRTPSEWAVDIDEEEDAARVKASIR